MTKYLIEKYLGESTFKVTVEKNKSSYGTQKQTKNDILNQEEFDNKKDAIEFKKKMIKKYKLINHGGRYITKDAQIELSINF
jgi:hypothetical protein